MFAARARPVEPGDEALHLFGNAPGGRGLEVDLWLADVARDDLHGFAAGAVCADVGEVAPAGGHHAMPGEEHLVGERLGAGAVESDHHFGDALFGWRDAALVGKGEAELALDRGLNAGAVQDFAFNGRRCKGLGAHGLDDEVVVVSLADVLDRAQGDARAEEKFLFSRGYLLRAPLKSG